jgi:hypothetical protein
MPQMTFDLLDGHAPVSLMLSAKDAERFAAFMGECFADLEDAERWRQLKKDRAVLLVTGYFGNGCVNRTVDDVEAVIDAARTHQKEIGPNDPPLC